MKKIITAIAAGALTLSMAACNTPGERAVGGAAIGGLAGAAIGGAATGTRQAAPLPAQPSALPAAPIVGAATAPRGPACPYGTYQDAYGNVYCR